MSNNDIIFIIDVGKINFENNNEVQNKGERNYGKK